MHFGIAYMSPQDGEHYQSWPEEFTYVTSVEKLESRAYDEGCVWCGLILSEIGGTMWIFGDVDNITVTVQSTKEDQVSGRSDQVLLVWINGIRFERFCIYAAPGASGRYSTNMELMNITR